MLKDDEVVELSVVGQKNVIEKLRTEGLLDALSTTCQHIRRFADLRGINFVEGIAIQDGVEVDAFGMFLENLASKEADE